MTQEDEDIHSSARELVNRLGHEALPYVQSRIAKLSERGMGSELDQTCVSQRASKVSRLRSHKLAKS